MQLVFVWQVLYISTWLLVKMSVCTALLRLTPYRRRRYVLFSLMGLAVATAAAFVAGALVQCSPVSAAWTGGQDACSDKAVLVAALYLVSAVNVFTDAIVATFSITILGHVRMRRPVKIFVAVVLSLGIL
jgi:hypothetical protein